MGFVADDQVELAEPVEELGLADDIDGMVGREDDAHVLGVVALVDFVGEALGIGGGRVAQLVGEGFDDVLVLLALLSDFGIGADGEGMERRLALLGPLGEGLGKQGEAGDEEEHALALAGVFLGDLQGGEGLPRAAGHDELATVSGLEAEEGVGNRTRLMLPRLELRLEDRALGRLVFGPVDLRVF